MGARGYEWNARHQMDRVQVDVQLHRDGTTQISVTGRSEGQRADLWKHVETVAADEHSLVASDIVHHLLICAMQDRPRDHKQFAASVRGQGWEDVALPF